MLGYVVPHTIYPNGYHCNPRLPLPFINSASQKKFIALYRMGIYANPELLKWFTSKYSNSAPKNWIWEKAASDLKNGIKFLLI